MITKAKQTKLINPVIARPFSGRGDLFVMKQIANRLLPRHPEKRAAHRNDGGSMAWFMASMTHNMYGSFQLDS